jgi:monothiol glutaredoxin
VRASDASAASCRQRWHPSAGLGFAGRELKEAWDVSELRERIKGVIEGEDVALFMKGTPEMIMCGNSLRALEALRRAGAPVTAVDILPDPAIRQELSALSGWPTIPQVFVRGELLGGADIVEELEQSGELGEKLRASLGEEFAAQERTLSLV